MPRRGEVSPVESRTTHDSGGVRESNACNGGRGHGATRAAPARSPRALRTLPARRPDAALHEKVCVRSHASASSMKDAMFRPQMSRIMALPEKTVAIKRHQGIL